MVQRKKTTKTQAAAKTARKETVTKDVAELSSEKIASSIAKSSVDISKQLAAINETAQEEIAKLNTIREAITFKEEELTELHGKEQVLKSIEELQLEAENSKNEFDAQVAERHEAWRKEQVQHEQQIADRNAQVARNRQREEDEYLYRIEQERKASDNEWNDKLYQRKLVEQRRIDALEQSWKDREAALAKREAEIAEKQELLENFDAKIKEAEEAAAAKAKQSVYAEMSIKTQLKEKDFENTKSLLDQKIQNYETSVNDYKAQIATLEQQNADAREKIQLMANAAMDATSGQASLQAVQAAIEKLQSNKR